MRSQSALCNVMPVEQRGKSRTEKLVAQEIGGKIHQNGRIDILEPDSEEEMHRIVCGEQQQRHAHDSPGAQVILEYGFLRCLGDRK